MSQRETAAAHNDGETRVDATLRAVREASGRLTTATRIVVAIIDEHNGHLTSEEIIAETERRIPGTAESTIYRVLRRLTDLHLVESVTTGPGSSVYHLRPLPDSAAHVHLVCERCQRISDVDVIQLDGLRAQLIDRYGFALDAHASTLFGVCAECLAE